MSWKNLFKENKKSINIDENVLVLEPPVFNLKLDSILPEKLTLVLEEEEEEVKIITSADIQKDITYSLEELLIEVNKPLERDERLGLLIQKKNFFEQQNQNLLNKIQNLEELGFINTPSVKLKKTEFEKEVFLHEQEINLIQEEIKYFENIKKLEKRYVLEYPSFKFVPERVMTKIMKKYNIFMGDVGLYSKEIPDKAIEIISNFKDIIKNSTKYVHLEIETLNSLGITPHYDYNITTSDKQIIDTY